MKVIVFGATGKAGQLAVRQALAAGHEVTAYVRNPAKLDRATAGLTVIEGALTDADAIARAIGGKDAVISLLGPGGKTMGTPIADGTRLIVAAMQRHNVQRLIATATPSATDPADRFAWSFWLAVKVVRAIAGSAYQDIVETAAVVHASSLDWTLVRLPMLSDKGTDSPVAAGFVGDPRIKLFSLSRHALAAFLVAQLTDRTWVRKAPALSNG